MGSVIYILIFWLACLSVSGQVVTYKGITFDNHVSLVVENTAASKLIFKGCVFRKDVILRSIDDGSKAGFDSVVFDNCRWTGYEVFGIRYRGNHKFLLVQDCEFLSDSNYQVKKHAISVTTNVTLDQRIGAVIIRGNVINQYSDVGSSIFGQKLTRLTITDNQFTINGRLTTAIKLDDTDAELTLITQNRFNIIEGWSAITLEKSVLPTGPIRIYDNWFNHKIAFINGGGDKLRAVGNTWDYTGIKGKTWYYYRNKVNKNSVWVDNTFIGQRYAVSMDSARADQFSSQNIINDGVKIAVR